MFSDIEEEQYFEDHEKLAYYDLCNEFSDVEEEKEKEIKTRNYKYPCSDLSDIEDDEQYFEDHEKLAYYDLYNDLYDFDEDTKMISPLIEAGYKGLLVNPNDIIKIKPNFSKAVKYMSNSLCNNNLFNSLQFFDKWEKLNIFTNNEGINFITTTNFQININILAFQTNKNIDETFNYKIQIVRKTGNKHFITDVIEYNKYNNFKKPVDFEFQMFFNKGDRLDIVSKFKFDKNGINNNAKIDFTFQIKPIRK
jgi:hypothetical protein